MRGVWLHCILLLLMRVAFRFFWLIWGEILAEHT